MKSFKYYKPRCWVNFTNSLWHDKTSNDEKFYHIISFQIRQKHECNAVLIVFFGISFIFTSLFLSDVIDKLVENND